MLENAVVSGLHSLLGMVWQMFWPLALGLMVSSLIRDWMPADKVSSHLGRTRPRSVALATLLGMFSSSCSYVAASLSKTLLSKGASMSNTLAFMAASTNLILEMFIVMVALLGWQFLWGEILGGLVLVVLVALLFRFYPKKQEAALRQRLAAESEDVNAASCGMEGMEGMDSGKGGEMQCGANMGGGNTGSSKSGEMRCGANMGSGAEKSAAEGSGKHGESGKSGEMHCGAKLNKPVQKSERLRRSARYFVMDIRMIGRDVTIGIVVSALVIAWVPAGLWQSLVPAPPSGELPLWWAMLEVALGIFLAIIAYVCSIGNLAIAAALWHGGLSFGAVLAFILSDLLTIPMQHVYRRYYGAGPARSLVLRLMVAVFITGVMMSYWLPAATTGSGHHAVATPVHLGTIGWNLNTLMNLILLPLALWYYRLGRGR
ncbi:hypothetical protein Maes01_00708 [Microbulbifer aestuariivivens]|uniref:Permease n=1 Tax=Microbulbifer aestuariivivens TaxID=1908308 RepID=A0ABP9WMB5_9GAMM